MVVSFWSLEVYVFSPHDYLPFDRMEFLSQLLPIGFFAGMVGFLIVLVLVRIGSK